MVRRVRALGAWLGVVAALALPAVARADDPPIPQPFAPATGYVFHSTDQVTVLTAMDQRDYGYARIKFATRPDRQPDGTLADAYSYSTGVDHPYNAEKTIWETGLPYYLVNEGVTWWWQPITWRGNGWVGGDVRSFRISGPEMVLRRKCRTKRVRRHGHIKRKRVCRLVQVPA